nr:cleavage and polyadenylation specificity factor subunit 6-like [Camelus dromedarius]
MPVWAQEGVRVSAGHSRDYARHCPAPRAGLDCTPQPCLEEAGNSTQLRPHAPASEPDLQGRLRCRLPTRAAVRERPRPGADLAASAPRRRRRGCAAARAALPSTPCATAGQRRARELRRRGRCCCSCCCSRASSLERSPREERALRLLRKGCPGRACGWTLVALHRRRAGKDAVAVVCPILAARIPALPTLWLLARLQFPKAWLPGWRLEGGARGGPGLGGGAGGNRADFPFVGEAVQGLRVLIFYVVPRSEVWAEGQQINNKTIFFCKKNIKIAVIGQNSGLWARGALGSEGHRRVQIDLSRSSRRGRRGRRGGRRPGGGGWGTVLPHLSGQPCRAGSAIPPPSSPISPPGPPPPPRASSLLASGRVACRAAAPPWLPAPAARDSPCAGPRSRCSPASPPLPLPLPLPLPPPPFPPLPSPSPHIPTPPPAPPHPPPFCPRPAKDASGPESWEVIWHPRPRAPAPLPPLRVWSPRATQAARDPPQD